MRKIAILPIALIVIGITVLGCPGNGGNGSSNGYVPPPLSPASFSVSNLLTEPAEILPGDTVTISATVANTGGSQGDYNAVLKINGVDEGTENINLSAGASQSVTFSLTRADSGTYEVSIGSLSDSFTVLSAEMILEEASEAMAEINTYQFNMDSVSTYTGDGGADIEITTTTAYGAVNYADNQAHQVMQMSDESGIPQTEEMYISGGWTYSYDDYSWKSGRWDQEKAYDNEWQWEIYATGILSFTEYLDYTLIGTEILDGIECYKLQSEQQVIEQGVELTGTVWISTNTHFIMQIFMDFYEDYGYTVVSTITASWYDYNVPVTIEVPLEATEVTFPIYDSIETAIRQTLNKAQGPIYMSDLETITILEAPDSNIGNLYRLEFCVNLQVLNLENNNIQNIYSLKDLTELNDLNLSNNNITDIWSLVINDGISSGDVVNLQGNPLNTYSLNDYIPQLVAKGVEVES